jgi:hypothetical protein
MAGTILDIIVQAQSNPNLLLMGVLLPFLLVFVIFWGMLNMIKIFGEGPVARKVNIILSLCVAILAGITPAWSIITGMAAFLGQFSWVAFVIVFIIGTILWMAGRTRGVYHENWSKGSGKDFNNLKDLDDQIAKVLKRMQEAEWRGDMAKMSPLADTLKELNDRKKALHQRVDLKSRGF